MNKLSKLTALLLALLMAIGAPMAAMAESNVIETYDQYIEVADDILAYMISQQMSWDDYTTLTDVIEDTDYADFYYRLTDKEKAELEAIVIGLFWDACITYDKYAPFLPAVLTPSTSTFSVQSRDGTSTAAEEGTMNTDALVLKKNAVAKNDGSDAYTITMETYTTGDVKVNVEYTPVDVVLVLDYTGSMDDPVETGVAATRIEALKNAITGVKTTNLAETKGFTEVFANANDAYIEKMAEAGVTVTQGVNRLSILRYCQTMSASGVSVLQDWIYLDSSTLNSVNTKVNNATNPGGGTPTGYAMQRALTQMTDDYGSFSEARKKVVILFTDGYPGTRNSGFDAEDAARAVNAANTLKGDSVGATVYSIVVYPGAKPTGTYNFTNQRYTTDTEDEDIISINTMLHAISSNFPSATATEGNNHNVTYTNTSDGDSTKGYYKSAGSAADLKDIFVGLAEETASGSANIKLDSSTVIKDVLTPYFVLPAGTDTSKIKVQSYKCTSYDEDTGAAVFSDTPDTTYDAAQNYTITIGGTDNNTITVSGFDFNANYLSETARKETESSTSANFHGRKLVISFDVEPTDGFLGGNDVVTNDSSSGVYKPQVDENGNVVKDENGNTVLESVKPYPIPDVDIDLWEITVVGKHQHIFLSNEADVNELLQSFSLRYTKEGGEESYEVDGIRNDYATLKFTLTAKSGNKMVYTISPGDTAGIWTYESASGDPITEFDVTPFLTEDAKYTISYDVIPIDKADGSTGVAATSGSLDVGVHVYKPTFTFQDSVEDYLASETAEGYYSRNNYVSESWSHTYYNEITVTINVEYDEDGTPSYSYVATNKDGATIATDTSWDMANETINFSGYESTAGIDYQVKMSGPKPTVEFTYSPVETTWITDGKVTAVECVDVNVTQVKLTSTNTHKKTVLGSDGALTAETYTTTSVYTEGSGSASVTITVNEENGTTSTTTVNGTPHIATKRIECTCSFCNTTDNKVESTNIHSDDTLEFVVHIKNAYSELQIIKKGLSVGESAIFTVKGYVPDGTADGDDQIWTVVLTKTSAEADPSVTITGLLVNSNATVTELGDWSWRYASTTYDPTSGTATIIPKNGSGYPATITVSNASRTDQWLSDESYVENEFTTVSTTTTN